MFLFVSGQLFIPSDMLRLSSKGVLDLNTVNTVQETCF